MHAGGVGLEHGVGLGQFGLLGKRMQPLSDAKKRCAGSQEQAHKGRQPGTAKAAKKAATAKKEKKATQPSEPAAAEDNKTKKATRADKASKRGDRVQDKAAAAPKPKKQRVQEQELQEPQEPVPTTQQGMFDAVKKFLYGLTLKEVTVESAKSDMVSALGTFSECRLNKYWVRGSIGVRSTTEGKDFAYFSYKVDGYDSTVCWIYSTAANLKGAELLVT